jgi:hypothetical protein
MCEDYRAGAYADYEIDKADFDAGKKITIPMLALWGDAGVASAAATPLDTWKKWATNVRGAGRFRAFSPEENPDADREVVAGLLLGGLTPTYSSIPANAGIQYAAAYRVNHCCPLDYWIVRFRRME